MHEDSTQCQQCGRQDAEIYRQNTRYTDDELNFATLCPVCREKNDAYWEERWREYYSGLL